MDISTFYAVTSAACFALVGLWWSVVSDKPEWLQNETMKRMVGGVFVSFLVPAVMSMGAQIGAETRLIWQLVFIIGAGFGCYYSAGLMRTAREANPNGIYGKNSWLAPVLYGLVLLFAIAPGFALMVGLAPLQLEALLLTILILAGHLLAWDIMSSPS